MTDTIEMAKTASGAVSVRSSTPTQLEVALSTLSGIFSQYEDIMAINRATRPEDGAGQQMALLRGLRMVLRLDGTDFIEGWNTVLTWAHQHRNDLWAAAYRNRFLDYAKRMSSRDRTILQALIHLIAITADPASRGFAISRYDFGRLSRLFEDDVLVAKLQGFYHQ